jgi:dTMP kinase
VSSRYVALEGVEGAGKSTVVSALATELIERGEQVVVVREPGGTPVGEEIRRLLLHEDTMSDWTEAALFAAARAELVRSVVQPALAKGCVVVSDRSYYSSLAYQGGGRALGVSRVRALNEAVLDGIVPDLVVVLAVDPDLGFAREIGRDRIGAEGVAFQHAVAAAYLELTADDPRVVSVDGHRETAEIVADIIELMGRS